ncbi:DUF3857 domain-containing protein [Marinirhabdus gelatinilytica]|uniref:Transglutaminase superfamily protein n=1 Tax=Marinirhabdus gelatinilytica TaxID=1703343 RepID=A0A370QJX1_9FLAO|nr:DUF3857 domain-containing protein [Marinirhabdus gelatinilytica]RDK88668.1 transglutaminase superfamily protein [Marinirhabdus gelatinilytica]
MITRILTTLCLCISVGTFGQESQDFLKYKNLYPEDRYVRLQQAQNVEIDLSRDKITIVQNFIEEDLYLDDGANLNSKESLNFSSFYELESIEASSFSFDGGKYRKETVENFTERDDQSRSFYDDTKTINFVYKNLRKGSKTRLEYKENVKDPRFLSPFFFGNYYPIENSSLEIEVHKDIDIRFLEFNTEGIDVQYEKEEKRNKNIYRWRIKNIDKFEYEPNAPTFKSVVPHIIPVINSYKVDGKKISVLNDVSDLYNWYASLVKNVNTKESSKDLKNTVNTLVSGLETDLEKVRAIYYWTQENIKYIAFEYALGGFIPREANDVFNKKYGDCKDNSSILKEMLKIAGIQGSLTWVGTREIPYTYKQVPTPLVDNHMILSYTENGETYYLDATGRYTPLDMPTSFIQGKEALVENGPDAFSIKQIPIVPASRNSITESTTLRLEGDRLVGASKASLTGYPKSRFFSNLENMDSKSQIDILYKDFFEKGNNKFLIQTYTENNKYSYELPFLVDYEFSIEDYARKLGDEIYINLNLNKLASMYKTEEDRELPVEYDFKQKFSHTTTFQIPAGYKVTYLPENVVASNELMDIKVSYQDKGDSIVYNQEILVKFIILDTAQQQQLNKLIEQAEKAYKEVLVLKKSAP